MLSNRTTARGILFLLLLAVLATAILASPAASAAKVPTIVFPLIADSPVDDNYGDARANGSHAGIDIPAPRMTPVVAAEDGTVKWWVTSARAGCMLYLHGASGTTYLYIHLNNDRTLGNDNKGGCVAGGTYTTKDGARVTAGQQIAWNGDSGDADGNPHLHFEVHPGDGDDVNPYPYLVRATRHLFPARVGSRFTVGLRGTPLAAGAGRLTLRATAVRWWPGGRWTPLGSRVVEIAIPAGAEIDRALVAPVTAPKTRALGGNGAATYSVFTAPAKATPAALRGDPGALAAARISRPGATLVPVEPGAATDPPVDDGEWNPPWERNGGSP